MPSEYSPLFDKVSKRIKSVYAEPSPAKGNESPKREELDNSARDKFVGGSAISEAEANALSGKDKFVDERVKFAEPKGGNALSAIGMSQEDAEQWSDYKNYMSELNGEVLSGADPREMLANMISNNKILTDDRDRHFNEFLIEKFSRILNGN